MIINEMIELKTLLKKLRESHIRTLAEDNEIDDIEDYSIDDLYELDDYDNLIASIDGVLYYLSENK